MGNLTVVDNEHAIRKRECFFRIVCHDERRELKLTSDHANALFDGLLDKTVQSRKRLVKQKDAWFENKRSSNGHTLLLAAGKFVDALVQVLS